MKYNKYSRTYFLFQILVIFVFYDGILHNSVFGSIKNIQYVTLLILLSIAIKEKCRFSKHICNIWLILFLLYHIIVGVFSIPDFIDNELEGLRIYRKYFILPVSLYLFYHFETITRQPYSKILLYKVNVAVVYVFVNTFLYFVELPVWDRYHPWWGRITQGYPTCDVVSLAFVLALLMLYKDLNISNIKRTLYSIVIVLEILMIASGTGIILIVTVFVAAVLQICIFDRFVNKLKNYLLYFICFFVCFFIVGNEILKTINPELYTKVYIIINGKIEKLTGKEVSEAVDTMEIRETQEKDVKKQHLKTLTDKIFGIGFGLVTDDSNVIAKRKNNEIIFIENQYGINKVTGGWISNILYICFLFFTVCKVFMIRKIKLADKMIIIISPLIIAISSFTVISISVYSIIISFSMIFHVKIKPKPIVAANKNQF
jgi:hypothetical protein